MSKEVDPLQTGSEHSFSAVIDRACDRFEGAWRVGERPRIEDYLGDVPEPLRSALLRELLLLELEYRRRGGEEPRPEDYRHRFPGHGELIGHVFGESVARDTSPTTLTEPRTKADGAVTAAVRYDDLRFHASGGLGEVFRAQDENLNRDVALKFIQHAHLAAAELRNRFVVEAEVTSRLDHPGVVPVYTIGESWDGRPFYAMRFIEGTSLQQAVDEFHRTDWKSRGLADRRQQFHRLLRHLAAACNTVAYANSRCIVHCDIKPANIMLGRFGETVVVDWGLAVTVKRDAVEIERAEKTLMPRSASPGDSTSAGGDGTVPFMSPEQCPASTQPITPRSDVYGLGATLYSLLTGRNRFRGCTREEAYARIRRGEFPGPREVDDDQEPGTQDGGRGMRPREIPRALEAICLKALQTHPADRYASALHLAQDIESWLSDEPVSVYREPWFERLVRVARRRRHWTQSLVVAALLVLLTATISATWLAHMYQRESEARAMAAEARQDALWMAAHYTAKSLSREVDQRWRILETAANDPTLVELLEMPADERPVGSAAQKRLKGRIAQRFWQHHEAAPATSWVVTDETGVIAARYPPSDVIGQPFAYRQYFHGGQRDLDPQDTPQVRPIQDPHLTAAFVSQATHNLMVAFSVPVWNAPAGSPQRRVVGVLVMTVEVAGFQALAGHGQRWSITLVDLKPDQTESQPQRGLVLHHPELVRLRFQEAVREVPRLTWRLDDQQLALADQVAERTRRQEQQFRQSVLWGQRGYERQPVPGSLQPAYEDPVLGGEAGPWLAALAPVLVFGRGAGPAVANSQTVQDTGWMVVIQQASKE